MLNQSFGKAKVTDGLVAQDVGLGSREQYRKAEYIYNNADEDIIKQLNEEKIKTIEIENKELKKLRGKIKMKKQEWINLLMENGGSIEEWQEIQAISRTDLFAMCRYKEILRNRDGRGKVEFTKIESSYDNNDKSSLHKLLNELFLEYYTSEEITNFLNLMRETGTSIKQIYNRHLENPESTLLSHLSL